MTTNKIQVTFTENELLEISVLMEIRLDFLEQNFLEQLDDVYFDKVSEVKSILAKIERARQRHRAAEMKFFDMFKDKT
jgi:hypothetical protein